MSTVNWKKWSDNGSIGATCKTHILGEDGKTLCGKLIPKQRNVEVEYFDGNYSTCKCCNKKN